MKNSLKYFFTLSFIALSFTMSNAQCQADECVSKISDGYIFLKSYKMEKAGNEVEYSYVFSKDTDYMLVTCNANNVIVTLFDSNKKMIATNYDPKTEKYYTALAYNCKATGIYYLKYSFKENSECCVSVLAFKK